MAHKCPGKSADRGTGHRASGLSHWRALDLGMRLAPGVCWRRHCHLTPRCTTKTKCSGKDGAWATPRRQRRAGDDSEVVSVVLAQRPMQQLPGWIYSARVTAHRCTASTACSSHCPRAAATPCASRARQLPLRWRAPAVAPSAARLIPAFCRLPDDGHRRSGRALYRQPGRV